MITETDAWYCCWCGGTRASVRPSTLQPAYCVHCVQAMLQGNADSRRATPWLLNQRAWRAAAIRAGLPVSGIERRASYQPTAVRAALAALGCTAIRTTRAGNVRSQYGDWRILIHPPTATVIVSHAQSVFAAGADVIRARIVEAIDAESDSAGR